MRTKLERDPKMGPKSALKSWKTSPRRRVLKNHSKVDFKNDWKSTPPGLVSGVIFFGFVGHLFQWFWSSWRFCSHLRHPSPKKHENDPSDHPKNTNKTKTNVLDLGFGFGFSKKLEKGHEKSGTEITGWNLVHFSLDDVAHLFMVGKPLRFKHIYEKAIGNHRQQVLGNCKSMCAGSPWLGTSWYLVRSTQND